MTTPEAIDRQLEQIRSGDRTAFQALFRHYYPDVCRTVHRYIVDPGLTEDLAQEVFVRFWEKRERINIESNPGAYLRRMGVNEALAHLRKKTRFQADELPLHLPGKYADSADEQLGVDELQGRIDGAVAKLPERCRLVFQLSRYEELSNREIAEQLDISIKTVENQMTKALRSLREDLSDYLPVGVVCSFLAF